jgi:hypothetical protein
MIHVARSWLSAVRVLDRSLLFFLHSVKKFMRIWCYVNQKGVYKPANRNFFMLGGIVAKGPIVNPQLSMMLL